MSTRVHALRGPPIMHMVTIYIDLFCCIVHFLCHYMWKIHAFHGYSLALMVHCLVISMLVVLCAACYEYLLWMSYAHPNACLPWTLEYAYSHFICGFHFVILVIFYFYYIWPFHHFHRYLLAFMVHCLVDLWAYCLSPLVLISAHVWLMLLKYAALRAMGLFVHCLMDCYELILCPLFPLLTQCSVCPLPCLVRMLKALFSLSWTISTVFEAPLHVLFTHYIYI